MSNTKKVSTVLGWFPTTPAAEREVLDIADARQIALRTRLRIHYWLTECQPLSEMTVAKVRRKMTLIDSQDQMTDAHVEELLTEHFGFATVPGTDGVSRSWSVPDLDESRARAVASIEGKREQAREAGIKSGEARRRRALEAPPVVEATDKENF